jgi:hypothetical protein
MPKPPEHLHKQNFLKRRSFAEGRGLLDAAHDATQRLYCDALRLWRYCSRASCKRHRRCCGASKNCLLRGLTYVPPSKRLKARREVIAGGRHRLAPVSHAEWSVRRTDLRTLLSWRTD